MHHQLNLRSNFKGENKRAVADTLVDSGATGILINTRFIKKHQFREWNIPQKIELFNADNSKSYITNKVRLQMKIEKDAQTHQETVDFYIGDIGSNDVILGTDWLIKHNPNIDWIEYALRMDLCPKECKTDPAIVTKSKTQKKQKKAIQNHRKQAIEEHYKHLWMEEQSYDDEYIIPGVMVARSIFHGKTEDNFTEEVNEVIK
jgi:hypothetical protein